MDEWVPITQAAARAGVSGPTVRKWVKSGEVPSREVRGERGATRTEVRMADVARRARAGGEAPAAVASSGSPKKTTARAARRERPADAGQKPSVRQERAARGGREAIARRERPADEGQAPTAEPGGRAAPGAAELLRLLGEARSALSGLQRGVERLERELIKMQEGEPGPWRRWFPDR